MIPIGSNFFENKIPIITWTLTGLNIIIYFWDREWSLYGQSIVFADSGMRPLLILKALFENGDEKALLTLFTGIFLHGNLGHLIINMISLLTFGRNVEIAFGSIWFLFLYFFWGVFSSCAHILMNMQSAIPTIGASGAIGGVLGSYFLLFPRSQVTIMIPPIFFPITISAWIVLGVWFVWQIFFPQEGVANWAHAGGFFAGMLTVWLLGGQRRLIRSLVKRLREERAEESVFKREKGV